MVPKRDMNELCATVSEWGPGLGEQDCTYGVRARLLLIVDAQVVVEKERGRAEFMQVPIICKPQVSQVLVGRMGQPPELDVVQPTL